MIRRRKRNSPNAEREYKEPVYEPRSDRHQPCDRPQRFDGGNSQRRRGRRRTDTNFLRGDHDGETKESQAPFPAPPPTGSEPRRSLEEIERSLREAEIVSMAPVGTGHMNVGGKNKSLPDKYLELVRALPRPSLEQTYRFAWFVAGAHSWYKKLPTHGTAPFVFYLDPYAGFSTRYYANGKTAVEEITDESDRSHYTWQTTADYHRRFGHWNYDADTPGEGASVSDGEGNWIAVPRPFLEAGRADVNAFMHRNTINWFWRPEPGEEARQFLGDPAAVAFGKEWGPADRLAKPFQSAVDERTPARQRSPRTA